MELVPFMEYLDFELFEEGDHSKLDDREDLRILMLRMLKGMKYVSQSIIQSNQETREFLAKQLASKH